MNRTMLLLLGMVVVVGVVVVPIEAHAFCIPVGKWAGVDNCQDYGTGEPPSYCGGGAGDGSGFRQRAEAKQLAQPTPPGSPIQQVSWGALKSQYVR